MKLSEYYKERMAANPELTRRELVDAVGSATVYAIQHDVPRNFRKSTLQKLAEMWKCSIGDIQACMAEMPHPLRKEAEKPEGQAGASITAKAGKRKKDEVDKLMREKPFAPVPDPEEPEPEVDMMFPVEAPAEEPEADGPYILPDEVLKHMPVPKEEDNINHPAHYYTRGGIECIEAIKASMTASEFRGYLKGNVMKYLWRYQLKNGVEDLRKAQWYLNRLIGEVNR